MDGFRQRLKKLRREKDITQGQLAEVLGLVPSAVGKYERVDSSYPSVDTLIKIADYFQISIDYLLKGTVPTEQPSTPNQGGDDGINALSPESLELVRIYESLNGRERIKLLSFAMELEEKQ